MNRRTTLTAALWLSICCLAGCLLFPTVASAQTSMKDFVLRAATQQGKQLSPEQVAKLCDEPLSTEKVGKIAKPGQLPLGMSMRTARAKAKANVASDLQITGSLVSSRAWVVNDSTYTPVYGIYSYSPATGNVGLVKKGEELQANGGGFLLGQNYCLVYYFTKYNMMWPTFYAYDINTWQQTVKAPVYNQGLMAYDATFDPTTNTIWGVYLSDDLTEWQLGFEYSTDVTHKHVVRTLEKAYYVLACSPAGKLYGIDAKGDLYQISKKDGSATLVGNTGVDIAPYLQSASFDRRSGYMYWVAVTTGGQALYEVDVTTGKASLVKMMPNNEEFCGIYVSSPQAYTGAPARVKNMVVDFKDASLSGNVSFTLPTTTYAGAALSGTLTYYVVLNGDTVNTGTGNAGSKVTVPLTVAKSGYATILVSSANAAGSSEYEPALKWVGADEPQKISKVTATVGTDSVITISWTASTASKHNFFFNKDSVKYNVTRVPDGAVIARGIRELSCTDASLNSSTPGVYSYTVEPTCYTTVGDTTNSNDVLIGGVHEVPFNDEFATTLNAGYELLLKVDANGDGIGWPASINKRMKYASLAITKSGQRPDGSKGDYPVSTDEWMLTPLLRLQQGVVYSFTLIGRGSGGDRPIMYDVAYGNGDDYSKYTVVATDSSKNHDVHDTWQTASKYTTRIYKFSVPQSGVYRVGFHVYRTVPEMNADNFKEINNLYRTAGMLTRGLDVEVVAKTSAPDSALRFTATPGALGAKKATLNITAPTLTAAHNRLEQLTGMRVYRNDTLINTITPAEPGHDYVVNDTTPPYQMVNYKVIAYNADGDGPEKLASCYVGEDVPDVVQNLRLQDTGAGFKLSWELPLGQHGGYVNPEKTRYAILGATANSKTYMIRDSLEGYTFTVDSIYTGPQKAIMFGVGSFNDLGGYRAYLMATVAGDPYELPYKESFTEVSMDQYQMGVTAGPWWRWVHNIPNATGNMTTSNMNQDYDGTCGSALLEYAPLGAQVSLNTPRISLGGAKRAKLTFYYKANPGLDIPMKVVVNDADVKLDTALVIEQKNEPQSPPGWRRATVDLTPYVNSKWVMIYFWFDIRKYVGNFCALDDIEVQATRDNDLLAELTGITGADAGADANVTLKVTNLGFKPANGYVAKLYADDKLVASQQVNTALATDSIAEFNFKVAAPEANAQDVALVGKVDYAPDELTDNNVTATELLPVEQTKPNRVDDLAGEIDDNGDVKLTWSTPQNVRKPIKESFETYTPFTSALNEGGWWAFDRQNAWTFGGSTESIFDTRDPLWVNGKWGSGDFRVWAPDSLGINYTDKTSKHYSIDGKRFLICSNNADFYGSDAWLISPELDGSKQAISFWAQTPDDYTYQYQVIEVLTSEGGIHRDTVPGSNGDTLNILAFKHKTMLRVPYEWTKFYVTLPEGTKHFAIRLISDGWFLKLDNVLYHNGTIEPTGYAIYRNGKLVGTVGTVNDFSDPDGIPGDKYTVVALYGNDASLESNEVIIRYSGITDVDANKQQKPGDIYNIAGQLVRQNATSADGLAPGIYIMNGKKIVVK